MKKIVKIYALFFLTLIGIVVLGIACQPQPIVVMVPGAGSSSAYPITVGQQPSSSAQAFDIFIKIQQIVCNGDPLPTCIQKIKTLVDTLTVKPDGGVR